MNLNITLKGKAIVAVGDPVTSAHTSAVPTFSLTI